MQRDACGVGFVVNTNNSPSHKIVLDGLTILHRMDHRGGRASDQLTGDGAGIMVGMPYSFFRELSNQGSWDLPEDGKYAVGMMFGSRDDELQAWAIELLSKIIEEEDLKLKAFRDVPVNPDVLGPIAKSSEPKVVQFFVSCEKSEGASFDWKLYVVRKRFEEKAREKLGIEQKDLYICSLSRTTIIYKGLLLSHLISEYYLDLKNPLFKSIFSLVHQRFSTNTLPAWPLAQPFRYIGHNGEINTLRGNINWMRARQAYMEKQGELKGLERLGSVCTPAASDSAILDNVVEFLLQTGRPMEQVLSMLVPEPWENNSSMPRELREYYEFQSCLMEPWDGPAFVGFCDGKRIGAILDRNGLRPGRYYVTNDHHVIMGSEAGLLDIPPHMILEKGRLSPGKMFLVDLESGVIQSNESIKDSLAKSSPYGQWLNAHRISLENIPPTPSEYSNLHGSALKENLSLFSYSKEDLRMIIGPMANQGQEPTGSMGNDTPIAILSRKRPLLFSYFKQLFAQVTNPPIDAIREKLVTSLSTNLGAEASLLSESSDHCKVIRLEQPVLRNSDLAKIRSFKLSDQKLATVSICYKPQERSLNEAILDLRSKVREQVELGVDTIVLSDRDVTKEVLVIPSLLATSAVHHDLINQGIRTKCSIVVESAEPREVHHFCLLLAYGAAAINPYLALDAIEEASDVYGFDQNLSVEKLIANYQQAISKGILKVMSKIGISTLQSYRGAQIFEAIGLSQELVDQYFTWTATRIGGFNIDDLDLDIRMRRKEILNHFDLATLPMGSDYHWRVDGEKHLHSPQMIAGLQKSTRLKSHDEFRKFCDTVDEQSKDQLTLRGLLKFKETKSISIDEVEPITSILKRFSTGAMSFGSISKEAHETIAVAMNRMGAKSNSGEGGEDPERFTPDDNGDLKRSAIKQVASGRFGVTSHYLVNSDELQIKIAQGAKPGEGGQLPGHKVDKEIAKVRHSTPGVTLISPPPHHDIYSIEDLAQLIHDLKNANDKARVSVKLVSAVGVGTIASGVAKAKSDVILISGYEGGTGASPLTSIKHTGMPWELGLSESHRSLLENGLRDRVVLQTDGQLRTPRDFVIATMLGAEEWSVGTGALLVLGCIMMRKCHLNTCPVGIATQDKELRKRFKGQPQDLINYFILVAEGMREILASLGLRTVDELVGRSDLLELRKDIDHPHASLLDFSQILSTPKSQMGGLHFKHEQDHGLSECLDNKKLMPLLARSIAEGSHKTVHSKIRNTDRTVGTILSSEISRRHGAKGLKEDTIRLNFTGSAGQSFMAFGARGITARIVGEVNDYCGKGLSGAKIVVVPPPDSRHSMLDGSIICGNTSLYGATSGSLHIVGSAGERFAVRNSGAEAVVEGVGDHCCEYMTGGVVVVLGVTGRNFGAGMSGGMAYVYNRVGKFEEQLNTEMVEMYSLEMNDEAELHKRLKQHYQLTMSSLAERLLNHWDEEKDFFVKVLPRSSQGQSTQILSKTTRIKDVLDPVNQRKTSNGTDITGGGWHG